MKRNFAIALVALPSFLTSLLGGHQSALTFQAIAGNSALNSSLGSGTSLNWAGYAATGGTFTSVGASWVVPQSTATGNTLSADATWVGIGGISSHDLIQAGTQTVLQNGTATYEAWYELLPGASEEVPLTIHLGDEVTVSVAQQSSGQWQISFVDGTSGQNYSASASYQSSLSSAEWIEEMPSDQRGFVPLDNFGTVSFAGGVATQNGGQVTISGSNAQPLTMINSAGQALADTSSLGAGGANFAVTRTSISASATPVITGRSGGRWSRAGVGVQGYAPSPRNARIGRFSFGNASSLFATFGNSLRNKIQFLRITNFRNK